MPTCWPGSRSRKKQGGLSWQADMNGMLRFYMESTEAMLREPVLEPYDISADYVPG
jgi:hypothetical protein